MDRIRCEATAGTHTVRNRLIELSRRGDDAVGWTSDTREISNGAGRVGGESLQVRGPWWRG